MVRELTASGPVGQLEHALVPRAGVRVRVRVRVRARARAGARAGAWARLRLREFEHPFVQIVLDEEPRRGEPG